MLQPILYHVKVRDHFLKQGKTWEFFAAAKTREEQMDAYKNELLKNTYKFNPETDKALYDKVEVAKEKLGMQQLSVTVYQAQYTDELNASIIFLNHEAHLVFSGRITQFLDDNELLAVIAHELTHIKLFSMANGDIEVADRIITAIANHHNSEPAYYETARLFRLYTEIFCDRGAYSVLGATGPVITSLVKAATGLDKVSAESYISQAEEIFSHKDNTKTLSVSHPENFIRARAIQLWHEKGTAAEEEIIKMIEGITDLDQLDIFKQKDLTDLTRTFLQLYLKPKWFRTTLVQSQAKEYFSDYSSNDQILLDPQLVDRIREAHPSIKDYLCSLLLDFALLDSSLEEVPFGWAFQFAEDVELKEAFDRIVIRELKLSEKKLQTYKQNTLAAFSEVKEGENEQIYEG
jgi:hypothetical protein